MLERAAKQATSIDYPAGREFFLSPGEGEPMAMDQGHNQAEAAAQVADLPVDCLAQAIALTSPRDACACAAVSPAFRAAADSDHVWRRFLPADPLLLPPPVGGSKKEAYLGLCDAKNAAGDNGCCRVWLERASGARCCATPARGLSLPWGDGEF